jgi:ATP-dependent helicase/nuclease subunit A
LGQLAAAAEWRKTKYKFRTLQRTTGNAGYYSPTYTEGVIDLLFEAQGCVHVVDFKTDKAEHPHIHLAQMASYYEAAKFMRQKECRVWLSYVRTGHTVEVTDKVQQMIP